MPCQSTEYYNNNPEAAARHREYQRTYSKTKYWANEQHRHDKRVKALARYHRLKAISHEESVCNTLEVPAAPITTN
tara:strand:- start:72 stop:299 length:228 start_codon:yes stop_codon:yes gene_type:complete